VITCHTDVILLLLMADNSETTTPDVAAIPPVSWVTDHLKMAIYQQMGRIASEVVTNVPAKGLLIDTDVRTVVHDPAATLTVDLDAALPTAETPLLVGYHPADAIDLSSSGPAAAALAEHLDVAGVIKAKAMASAMVEYYAKSKTELTELLDRVEGELDKAQDEIASDDARTRTCGLTSLINVAKGFESADPSGVFRTEDGESAVDYHPRTPDECRVYGRDLLKRARLYLETRLAEVNAPDYITGELKERFFFQPTTACMRAIDHCFRAHVPASNVRDPTAPVLLHVDRFMPRAVDEGRARDPALVPGHPTTKWPSLSTTVHLTTSGPRTIVVGHDASMMDDATKQDKARDDGGGLLPMAVITQLLVTQLSALIASYADLCLRFVDNDPLGKKAEACFPRTRAEIEQTKGRKKAVRKGEITAAAADLAEEDLLMARFCRHAVIEAHVPWLTTTGEDPSKHTVNYELFMRVAPDFTYGVDDREKWGSSPARFFDRLKKRMAASIDEIKTYEASRQAEAQRARQMMKEGVTFSSVGPDGTTAIVDVPPTK
jgi:hypothetical protein